MNKVSQLKIFLMFVLLGFVIFYFLGFFELYFQQDEWRTFGHYIYLISTVGDWGAYKSFFASNALHYTPLNSVLHFSLFRLFALNHTYWIVITMFLHILNTYFIFLLGHKLTKSRKLSIFSAMLFLFMYAGRQAYTWFGVSTNTLPATLFGLFSLNYYLNYISTNKTIELYKSLTLLVVSLLFKEITIGLFGLYLLFPVQNNIRKYITNKNIVVASIFTIYVLLRIVILLLPSEAPKVGESQSVQNKQVLVTNFFLYPIKTVSQSLVPVEYELKAGSVIYKLLPIQNKVKSGTTQFDVIVHKYFVTAFDFIIFGLVILLVYRLRKNKYLTFLIIFVILNSLIYAISPERSGSLTLIDSRNLYFPSSGIALSIVVIAKKYWNRNTAVLLTILLLANILIVFIDLRQKSNLSQTQLYILQTIKQNNPRLDTRTVFYIESDKSYFGLPTGIHIPPFQSGLGKILLVSYYPEVILPPDFYQHEFLWNIESQGHLQQEDYLYGYYRNLEDLKKFTSSEGLDFTLISYKYFSDLNRLNENKDETMEYLLK